MTEIEDDDQANEKRMKNRTEAQQKKLEAKNMLNVQCDRTTSCYMN